MHFAVAAGSDVGLVRSGNEDAYFADANEYRGLFIVADGMGGHAAGEVASQMTVEIVSRSLAELNDLESVNALEDVSHAIEQANLSVYERSIVDYAKGGMGTTVSLLVLADQRFIIGHVGDSRIYLLRDGELRQLTHDHSVVQEELDAGMITLEEAKHHRRSHMITRCVGIARGIEPDILDGDVHVGDIFLLASDGLTGMIEDRRLQQLLSSRATPARMVDALIAEANARGGVDNITAVVVRIHSSAAMTTDTHPAQNGTGPGRAL